MSGEVSWEGGRKKDEEDEETEENNEDGRVMTMYRRGKKREVEG